ncbi:methyl-accepting chemotaxis protein [Billgrantia sp. Q4P2]|uniref:methyl-accepting chemotaxis protein n=1 Tax=Billgrantia sp. Q4P2 TaxID=3463857 RepID=UPI00405621BE
MDSSQSLSVKAIFRILFSVVFGLTLLILAASYASQQAEKTLETATESRYQSFLLATELRQSSDALTRLARTFVITGDPKWTQQYQEVIDIRAGSQPRPQHYERIHWDFLAADQPSPHPMGEPAGLLDLMRQAGFSEQELEQLAEAQRRSNDLVELETEAMALAERAHRATGGASARAVEANLQRARRMMYGEDYHRYKANIMEPIDEFYALLDARTAGAVADASRMRDLWSNIALALAAALVIAVATLLWWGYRGILGQLGAEPAKVRKLVERISQGDLSTTIELKGIKPQSLLSSLARMQDALRKVVKTVREGSEGVAAGTAQIAAGNTDLSQRTEEQASNLQQTAASMEQITSTVQNSAETATHAEKLANGASEAANQGGEVVSQVVATMADIQSSSKRIANIIAVMDEIAFQTNILALNASVEAARAGEQGRGFAVVAQEVRSLAQRSSASAQEIRQLIQDSVAKIDAGSELASQAGGTMREIVEQVRNVTRMIGEISAATAEQTIGIAQVSDATTQLDAVTQQNASLVEEAAAAADSLDRQARHLVEAVRVFKLEGTDQAIALPAPQPQPDALLRLTDGTHLTAA